MEYTHLFFSGGYRLGGGLAGMILLRGGARSYLGVGLAGMVLSTFSRVLGVARHFVNREHD